MGTRNPPSHPRSQKKSQINRKSLNQWKDEFYANRPRMKLTHTMGMKFTQRFREEQIFRNRHKTSKKSGKALDVCFRTGQSQKINFTFKNFNFFHKNQLKKSTFSQPEHRQHACGPAAPAEARRTFWKRMWACADAERYYSVTVPCCVRQS